jgi:hypothetical protein
MTKVESILFIEGDFPQYPECPFAGFKDDKWSTPAGGVLAVYCYHPNSPHYLCCTNYKTDKCPF